MARLIRPLRQWPQLQQHCCSQAPSNHLLSSILLPTLTTKNSWSCCLCLTSVASSRRNVHHRSRGLRLPNAPTTSDPKEGDNTSDSDSELKKSRNQKKREAKRAVHWGMDLAAFSTPQIKRILKVASLDQDVLDALMLVKRLGPDVKEGKRRQYNYIGESWDGTLFPLILLLATKDGDHHTLHALAGSEAKIIGDDDQESEESENEEEEEESLEHINKATRWFDGLISKDVQITNEVYSIQNVDFDRQELRKLVKRVHASEESRTVVEVNEREVDAAIISAKKSLTRFLRTLAKRIAVDDV
ncbi:hypothetical protein Pint_09366 [Pistacia integerrima]|uniref:Uncharacterized protein n=1 Tax=Pistacia integerrima TaxID=434235 RepID=A0ACC0XVA7_9ROSI|nr:hypothetical protein Pint_09366 [Pistacia integerrima]